MAIQNHNFAGPNCEPIGLNSRHHLAAALRAMGHTQAEIAAALGLNHNHIAILCTSDLFKAEVARIQETLKSQLVSSAVNMLMSETKKSVETIVSIRDNPNNSPTVRLKASDTILNKVPETSNATRVQSLPAAQVQFSDQQVSFLITALNEDPKAKEAFEAASKRSMLEMVEVDDPQPSARASHDSADLNQELELELPEDSGFLNQLSAGG